MKQFTIPLPADCYVAENKVPRGVETNKFKGSLVAPSHSAIFFCSMIAILETTIIAKLASAKMALEQRLAYNIKVLKITKILCISKRHLRLSQAEKEQNQGKHNHCKRWQSESRSD